MSFVIENNILKGVATPTDVDRKLGRLIYDALDESPDHVAQIDAETGGQTTCGEMKDRSVRCALGMRKLGVGPDDIVVVVTHNHLDSYIPVFATFFVDAVFSGWHHKITLHSARRFMKKFTPKLIFTCEKSADVLMEAASLENVDVEFVVFGKHTKARSLNDILDSQTKEEVDRFAVVNERSPQDVAAVMLSSGSTGFPKGVMIKSGQILTMAQNIFNAAEHKNSPEVTLKFLWYSTLDWVSCIMFLLVTVLNRNTRIIPSHTDVISFLNIVQKYKVNYTFIPPILVSYLANSDLARDYDLRSLRTFFVAGSKISKKTLEGLRQKIPAASILQAYGSTEIGFVSRTSPETKHIESAGFVPANYQVKFVDLTSGEALGPNRKGEIHAKTRAFMIGYYKDPVATKQAFDEEGWYRTGDLGYYNEAGEIFIVDRIKEIMKCKYYHVSPAEIEELLLSHPEVQEAAVVGVPHELDGDWPAAFVKKTPGSRVIKDDLTKLTSVLEDYKKLRGGIHFLESLPQTGSGKIAKNELRQLAIALTTAKCS